MVEPKVLNPRDKTANYFREIKWFLRNMYTVNINNKRQVGVGEMIKLFILTLNDLNSKSKYNLGVIGISYITSL